MESTADSRILTLTWEIIGIILLVILIQFIILMMTSVTEMIGLPTSIGDFSFLHFFSIELVGGGIVFFFVPLMDENGRGLFNYTPSIVLVSRAIS